MKEKNPYAKQETSLKLGAYVWTICWICFVIKVKYIVSFHEIGDIINIFAIFFTAYLA